VIHVVLPVPPTTNNRLIGLGSYKGYKTRKTCKKYQEDVRNIASSMKIKPIEGPVAVCVVWYRKAKRGDISDRFKDMFDALETRSKRMGRGRDVVVPQLTYGAYLDDKQITFETVLRSDKENNRPRIEFYAWSVFDSGGWDTYFSMLPSMLGQFDVRKVDSKAYTALRRDLSQ